MEITFTVERLIKKSCHRLLMLFMVFVLPAWAEGRSYLITEDSPSYIRQTIWPTIPSGGDTIYVNFDRTKAIKFVELIGEPGNPIVVINSGGQVHIDAPLSWGAIEFQDCRYVKISGSGDTVYRYGFVLSAGSCGLAFSGFSSDCEAEFVKVSHDGFFGIMAKKDFKGNPPTPVPVFENLTIHDCFVENVSEGMYLGETKSPGMEFRHVRVYNNIVRNTKRECIQIANMVEDVEVFNNTLINGGTEGLDHQGSLFQIGDNTVVKLYNNIMIGASSFGVACYGMGNNEIYNNYFRSCNGIFVDNRLFSLVDSVISIRNNYFSDIRNPEKEVIRNMNEVNFLRIENNVYDDSTLLLYRNYYPSNTNFVLLGNSVQDVPEITFADTAQNNYALSASTHPAFWSMGAPGGPEILVDLLSDSVARQIVLSPDMVYDEVLDGSLNSPAFLVDEQNCTPENGVHPVSLEWKPAWTIYNGPYHCFIDLGAYYKLSSISLHDTYNIKNLEVSVGEPGNWEYLFTETCDKYKKWKVHEVDIITRYIRLSMYESPYASVNEIVVYGSRLNYLPSELKSRKVSFYDYKSEADADLQKNLADGLMLMGNPVRNTLRVNLPYGLNENFYIDVYDISGRRMVHEYFGISYSSEKEIDLQRYGLNDGIYIMRYSGNGVAKAIKFVKQSW